MAGPITPGKQENIVIYRHDFMLHPSGALFWKEEGILVVSDLHLGKISHFRKHGSAVPLDAIKSNFDKMDELLLFFQPEKILFLGDLFHSVLNREWFLFENWVERVRLPMILIEGNHDIVSPLRYEKIGIKIFPEMKIRNFLFTHHPQETEGFFNFAGHLHPGIRITGSGREVLKLPCFWKRSRQMILPAIGAFTGLFIVQPQEKEEVFVVTGDEVIPLQK